MTNNPAQNKSRCDQHQTEALGFNIALCDACMRAWSLWANEQLQRKQEATMRLRQQQRLEELAKKKAEAAARKLERAQKESK